MAFKRSLKNMPIRNRLQKGQKKNKTTPGVISCEKTWSIDDNITLALILLDLLRAVKHSRIFKNDLR